jgi:putative membrane protein
MGNMLRSILSSVITLGLLAWLVPAVSFSNWVTLVIAAIVLLFLQSIVKPVLKLLFLPVTVVTLGLFSVVINVAVIWLATFLVPGFQIQNLQILGIALNQFFSLLTISILISCIASFVRIFIK